MPAISLRQIEIFHAVMTTGNLTEAAVLLRTSQPTISRELARFERCLQLCLFKRIRGRLHPTSEGLRLFEEVQRSYYGLERIMNAADSIRQFQQAQLSIVCLPVFAQSLLPAVCRLFHQRYPETSFSVVPQESPVLEEWLTAQRHDLGLTENSVTPAGTKREPLLVMNEVCIVPKGHPLSAKKELTPEDFAQQSFISLSPTDPYRQLIDALFQKRGIARRMLAETPSAASVCAMVAEGMGVSIVNPLTALEYAGRGLSLHAFSMTIPFMVSLIQPIHRPSSLLVQHFTESLYEHCATLPEQLNKVIATG